MSPLHVSHPSRIEVDLTRSLAVTSPSSLTPNPFAPPRSLTPLLQSEMKGDLTQQRRWEAYDKLGAFVIYALTFVLGIQAIGLEGEVRSQAHSFSC